MTHCSLKAKMCWQHINYFCINPFSLYCEYCLEIASLSNSLQFTISVNTNVCCFWVHFLSFKEINNITEMFQVSIWQFRFYHIGLPFWTPGPFWKKKHFGPSSRHFGSSRNRHFGPSYFYPYITVSLLLQVSFNTASSFKMHESVFMWMRTESAEISHSKEIVLFVRYLFVLWLC